MSDQFRVSFANAVASAQPAFAINRDEEGNRTGFIGKDVFKVVTRVPVNVTLALLTSIESVVRAVFTVVTSVLYPITKRPFNYFKESTKATFNATVVALKGTVGYGVVAAKEGKKTSEARTQSKVETTPSKLDNVVRFAKSINKTYVVAGAAAAVGLYLFGGPILRGLVAGTKEGFSTFGSGVSDNLGSAYNTTRNTVVGAYDATLNTVVNGAGLVASGAVAVKNGIVWPYHALFSNSTN